jgi:putative transposase
MRTVEGKVYHVFNKSIAGFNIFNNDSDFLRIKQALEYYQDDKPAVKLSKFIQTNHEINPASREKKLVEIIAYCIMPTHFHLILNELSQKGISTFMGNALNSYTRYFNIKHNRKGPLWEGRFKKVLVENDEQLLHLTRYVHLNPVTAYLVNDPLDWSASSYREYVSEPSAQERICSYSDFLEIKPESYKKFIADTISYQRDLSRIKKLIVETSPIA